MKHQVFYIAKEIMFTLKVINLYKGKLVKLRD